jgi:aerobic carbon-monoxide dehydrogenase medium subunit
MIPAAFDYRRPGTLDEALQILSSDEGARILAGGQSLLPLMKLRLASAETLVDIGRLSELRGIRRLDDGRLAIGALTTYTELMASPVMSYGLLADALPHVGDVQVRNRGTIGGAVAHADPASDLPACLITLDAELVARSSSGERTLAMETFCESAFVTGLREGEILTEIRLPAPRDDAGSAYRTLEQPASGYAMVGVAAVVMVGADGRITDARLGVTGVADRPYRATAADRALVGTDGSGNAVAAAAARVAEGHVVSSDIHADREYRAAMAVVYARRAIEGALARLAG